jgi:hypothetical protein
VNDLLKEERPMVPEPDLVIRSQYGKQDHIMMADGSIIQIAHEVTEVSFWKVGLTEEQQAEYDRSRRENEDFGDHDRI